MNRLGVFLPCATFWEVQNGEMENVSETGSSFRSLTLETLGANSFFAKNLRSTSAGNLESRSREPVREN